MTTTQVLMKTSSVKLLFDPSWIDGCPGCPGPVFNKAIGDYAIAGLLRQIAGKLGNREFSARLYNVSRDMAKSASAGLANGLDEGDDICPPWWPYHFPHKPKPQPDPWDIFKTFSAENYEGIASMVNIAKFSPAAADMMLAGAIKQLSALASSTEHGKEIFSVGQSIVQAAASRLYDEYCGNGYHGPRPHFGNIENGVLAEKG